MQKKVLRIPGILGLCIPLLALLIMGSALLTAPRAQAAHTSSIYVPYYSQYAGQAWRNYDCGPASVAMALAHYGKGPGGSGAALAAIRSVTGNYWGDTGFADLERALYYYGSSYWEISNAYSPQPTAQIQIMQQAVNAGEPVIALINALDFGRSYSGHWVVVTGFSNDGQTVYLNDPDNQAPRYAGWIPGGPIAVSMSTFRRAAYDAPAGPYGIVVSG